MSMSSSKSGGLGSPKPGGVHDVVRSSRTKPHDVDGSAPPRTKTPTKKKPRQVNHRGISVGLSRPVARRSTPYANSILAILRRAQTASYKETRGFWPEPRVWGPKRAVRLVSWFAGQRAAGCSDPSISRNRFARCPMEGQIKLIGGPNAHRRSPNGQFKQDVLIRG